MKKNMFELWYEKFGRDLAKKTLPIDDVEEKELRKEAKKIFSYTYDLFSESMNERLVLLQDYVREHIYSLQDLYEENKAHKDVAELAKKSVTLQMTQLYDSFYKNKSIDEDLFKSLKSHFGNIHENAKQTIKACEENLVEIKREIKLAESMIIN